MVMTQSDNSLVNRKQIGGTHYQKLDPAPWDVILKWNLGYLEGTALKYIARWRDKGGLDDIRKAIHFLEKLVEVEQDKEEKDSSTSKRADQSSPWPYPLNKDNKNEQSKSIRKVKKN